MCFPHIYNKKKIVPKTLNYLVIFIILVTVEVLFVLLLRAVRTFGITEIIWKSDMDM